MWPEETVAVGGIGMYNGPVETVNLNITKRNFESLEDVDNYIAETVERYKAFDNLSLASSNIHYNNGNWIANLSFRTAGSEDYGY